MATRPSRRGGLRALLAGVVLAVSTVGLAGPVGAQECQPDDGTPCCKDYSEKVNSISRRYTGQDLLLCTQ